MYIKIKAKANVHNHKGQEHRFVIAEQYILAEY